MSREAHGNTLHLRDVEPVRYALTRARPTTLSATELKAKESPL
jgi:hypothetical protein